MGQSGVSTVLLQRDNTLTNIPLFTTDFFYADQISDNNVTGTGTIDENGNVSMTFTFGNNGDSSQPVFTYTYTGKLHPGKPTTITGTYATTVSPTFSDGTGNFEATFFPSFDGAVYSGTLTGPDAGNNPTNVPVTINLTTNPDFSLRGTVEAGQLGDRQGNACFADTLVITSNLNNMETSSFESGVYVQIIAKDSLGRELLILAYSMNSDGSSAAVGELFEPDVTPNNDHAGTNDEYGPAFIITGGPCNQLSVSGGPLQLRKICRVRARANRRRGLH